MQQTNYRTLAVVKCWFKVQKKPIFTLKWYLDFWEILSNLQDEIKSTCKEAANDLHRSSVMIEDAVEDLVTIQINADCSES